MTNHMSEEGRALLRYTHPSSRMPTALMADLLATLEHDMSHALLKEKILLADWINHLKKSEEHRAAFVRVLFLIVAASGWTVEDVRKLRKELMNVSPSRRRQPKIIHEPRNRETRSLF